MGDTVLTRLAGHLTDRGEQVELVGGVLIGGGIALFGFAEGDVDTIGLGASIMALAILTDAGLDDILGRLP